MRKQQWDDLPEAARAAVTARCGPVVKAEAAEQGIMPGLAARLHLESGESVFLKGISQASHAVRLYHRERIANLTLPARIPAPRMLWAHEAGGWTLLAFQFIEAGRRADLSPGSPDIPRVLAALRRIGGSGRDLPAISENLEMLQEKAAALLANKPDGPQWDMYADALSGLNPPDLSGDELLHYDLHAGNLMVTHDAVYVLDWSFACRGAAWIDAALLVPRFIAAGHTPTQAEELASSLPARTTAPPAGVTALGALWTMFREYKALHGPENERGLRQQAAQAGRAWLTHRTR